MISVVYVLDEDAIPRHVRDEVQSFDEIRYLEFTPSHLLSILNPFFTILYTYRNTYHAFPGKIK